MQETNANPRLVAHTPGPVDWDDLDRHLNAVADCAEKLASKFGASEVGRLLGITHDLAKADPRFQRYLRDCEQGKRSKSCPHATPSAKAASGVLGPFGVAIVGHHSGMPDACETKGKFDNCDPESVRHAEEFLSHFAPNLTRPALPAWATSDKLAAEMLIRMAFSCLVDADFLDTEAHFHPEASGERGGFSAIAFYEQSLREELAQLAGKPGKVNAVRAEILQACQTAAAIPKGAFRLTVPTGGGKTLSGLAFGLGHAAKWEMDRVIVAIPYTSIIDQTASIYREIFGDANVLEHHSAVDIEHDEDDQTELAAKRRLNIQNWDCPLIVTTTVQLFESLLHNKPSKCRKLHNIANSVIILDEVQALPPKTLKPILDVLNELVSHYGCTVVFCTATQLDYSTVDDRLVREAKEIVSDFPRHFEILKRVRYEVVEEPWSVERAAQEIGGNDQVLAVFNTRKDALKVAREISKKREVIHLSTLMCGHHRKRVIEEVRRKLKNHEPICLISTQVVEAGVDFDFPIVYRDLGPLDRIIQVAGRCNREGRLTQMGRCIVFRLEGGGKPQGVYATAIEETKTLLVEFGERLDAPEALRIFSYNVFGHTNVGDSVQKLRAELKYRSVAETFRLIDQDTTPLIVEGYPFEDVGALIGEWQYKPGGWFRRVSPFTVNVYRHELSNLQSANLVRPHESGAWIYSGAYDAIYGLTGETQWTDPADLIF